MRKILFVAASVAAAAALASAQETAPAAAKNPHIAVVDLERVTQESLLGKSYSSQMEALNNEIEAEKNKKRNELQKMETDIKALQDELEKQAALLSEDAAEKKRAEIVKKNRDREAYYEDGRAELERMSQKAQNQAQALNAEFQAKIQPLIESVVKAQGIDILLDRRLAISTSKAFDVTNEVIVKIDDAERAKPSGAAKPAAAKPAAAAPAKPQAPAPKPSPAKP
jgi:Skp family chaperone for outer membrane proteins